ncbi:MAG: LysR substrate-binding domain-containing protein [Pseudomonadales bacterium]|nr:LysR substrate-binding domain-containing protein [Pseudomonadales bacterium]
MMDTHLRSVDLNLLVIFSAIMEEHSLSAAAKRLNMTQPAVSNALTRLRHTFKDDLFIRTRHGMTPSSRALELLPPIQDALRIIQTTIDERRQFDPNTSNRAFRIALDDQSEATLLPRVLKILEKAGPNISLEVEPNVGDENISRLNQGQLDFLFTYHKPEDTRLNIEPLNEDCLVVIARKNHPRVQGKITREQFATEKHVILKHRFSDKTFLETVALEDFGRRKILSQVQLSSSIPLIVAKTDALGVVSQRIAENIKNRLPINVYPLPFEQQAMPYFMIWTRNMDQDLGHQWLKEIFLSISKSN